MEIEHKNLKFSLRLNEIKLSWEIQSSQYSYLCVSNRN